MKVKKLTLLITVLCLCFSSAFGCVNAPPPDNSAGVTATLIVLDLNYAEVGREEFNTDKSYLAEAFADIATIIVISENMEFGLFMTEVLVRGEAALKPAGNQYIALYHDITDDATLGVTGGEYNFNYGGKEYISSFVGISELPVKDGATYVLKLSV